MFLNGRYRLLVKRVLSINLVTDMLFAILKTCTREELEEKAEDVELTEKEARRKHIKNKIMAVGMMARTFQTLRKERESIVELKNVMGVESLPAGTLALGSEGIKNAIDSFENAKKADEDNERLPPVGDGLSRKKSTRSYLLNA